MAYSELLCTDVDSIALAGALGADRIELCSALEVGGVTPGPGLLREALRIRDEHPLRRAFEVVVLARPRRGDFDYGGGDFAALLGDVEAARVGGADGVALGVLTPGGEVDLVRTRALVEAAGPMKVTFHRALDHAHGLAEAAESLVELGVARLLTSGGAPAAWDGRAALRELTERMSNRVEVVAAGGIRGDNAAEVLASTGAAAIHGSCSRVLDSGSAGLPLGHGGAPGEAHRVTLDEASARAFIAAARLSGSGA